MIVDLALAALMIGVSGFIFGSGPESAHSGTSLPVAYVAGVIACVAASVAGFILHRRAKTGTGMLAAGGGRAINASDSGALLTPLSAGAS